MTDRRRKNPAAVALGRRRAKTLTAEHQAVAGRAAWASMTPDERAAEMSRRRRLGVERRRARE